MADASRGLGYLHLVNVAQWHIGDDNYVAARAAIVNAHHRHPMAAIWDDGTTSSSDGQYFRAGGRAGAGGSVNAKYGIDPGAVLYTHVSGHYEPFHTRVISATMSEAPTFSTDYTITRTRLICASSSTTLTPPERLITCSDYAICWATGSHPGSRI